MKKPKIKWYNIWVWFVGIPIMANLWIYFAYHSALWIFQWRMNWNFLDERQWQELAQALQAILFGIFFWNGITVEIGPLLVRINGLKDHL